MQSDDDNHNDHNDELSSPRRPIIETKKTNM